MRTNSPPYRIFRFLATRRSMKLLTKLTLLWWLLTKRDAPAWDQLLLAYQKAAAMRRLRQRYDALERKTGLTSRQQFQLAKAENDNQRQPLS